jgi:molybdopterin/thiamine biosynthesis adenylyltransferase
VTPPPRRVTLRPSVEVFAASDGTIYILDGSGAARFVVRGGTALERCLLQSLDGRSLTVAELARRLAGEGVDVDAGGVGMALGQLSALGLLSEDGGDSELDGAALARLDRQLAWLSDRFPSRRDALAAQERLAGATVAVLGCGGLGSWTLAALACAGVGRLVVVDDDTVEPSNLNRQILFGAADVGRPKVRVAAEALRRFNPATEVVAHRRRLASAGDVAEVVAGASFVVETADWPMYEMPRWVDRACRRHGVPHISAAQHPPLVRIGPLRVPGRSACHDCVEAAARERYPLYDELAAFRAKRARPTPTLGTASALIGSLVAGEALHLLTGAHAPATLDRSLVFDLSTLESRLEPEALTACPHTG